MVTSRPRLEADPSFRPLLGAELVTLAELARDGGDRPLARALLADFDARYPDDPARDRARRVERTVSRHDT